MTKAPAGGPAWLGYEMMFLLHADDTAGWQRQPHAPIRLAAVVLQVPIEVEAGVNAAHRAL